MQFGLQIRRRIPPYCTHQLRFYASDSYSDQIKQMIEKKLLQQDESKETTNVEDTFNRPETQIAINDIIRETRNKQIEKDETVVEEQKEKKSPPLPYANKYEKKTDTKEDKIKFVVVKRPF